MAIFWWIILLLILGFLFKRFVLEKLVISKLNSRHVFITGCDSGFGHLLAVKLVESGIPTFAGCYTEQGKVELKRKCKVSRGNLWTVSLDVTNSKSVSEAFDFVKRVVKDDGLWGLVCNAGVANVNAPDDWLTVDDYKSTAEVNLHGVIRTCQTFKPLIKKTKGRIVIITSSIGRLALPALGPYAVSKFAAEAYADVLRLEGKAFGYTVHILEPGLFKTNLFYMPTLMKTIDRLWARLPKETKSDYGETFFNRMKANLSNNLPKMANENVNLVVDAYYHALTSKFPRLRYYVGNDAKFFYIPVSFYPTFLQDFVIGMMLRHQDAPIPDAYFKL